mgnify:CR=1 FL=1
MKYVESIISIPQTRQKIVAVDVRAVQKLPKVVFLKDINIVLENRGADIPNGDVRDFRNV